MPRHAPAEHIAVLACVAAVCLLYVRKDSVPQPAGRLAALPRVTLWAWERREDLHALDTKRFAVAYLDKTITIGQGVASQPRRDAVFFPAQAAHMPVVRIEAGPNAALNDANRRAVVDALAETAQEPGIAALQIDFDATRSQREFYRALLDEVRRRMPAGLPLSMTALASWCSWDDWLHGLPVDEAVPMLFRMEPDRRRAPASIEDFRIREPLCSTSVGVSTTEPWPDELEGKRVYVFADRGWSEDTPADVERRLR